MTEPAAPDHDHDHYSLGGEDSEEMWRAVLTGEARPLERTKKLVGWIPSGPRCKLCLAPMKAPGSLVLRPFGFGPSPLNKRLCRCCFKEIDGKPGGAEIELSLLFADVRGSTGLGEHIPAQEFSQLISRFYGTADVGRRSRRPRRGRSREANARAARPPRVGGRGRRDRMTLLRPPAIVVRRRGAAEESP
jgi:hypothetical protein